MTVVAALYVKRDGSYWHSACVDPWDEARDARLYAGPHPVVAHPPCQRWGKLWAGQPLLIKKTGIRKKKGDDDGCFKAALAAVRKWRGVIEHPDQSHAWVHFGLNKPPREGGWIPADDYGGWTCCVEQGRYGHHARKPTWLYVFGTDRPELDWGKSEMRLDPEIVARIGLNRAKRRGEVASKGGGTDSSPRIGTPPAFRELLLDIARSANPKENTMPARSRGNSPATDPIMADQVGWLTQNNIAIVSRQGDDTIRYVTVVYEGKEHSERGYSIGHALDRLFDSIGIGGIEYKMWQCEHAIWLLAEKMKHART